MSAYEFGIKAYDEGLWRFENPFKEGTKNNIEWDDGWMSRYDSLWYWF